MRTVIVHYHIYKNSGTSFEQVLDASFGDRHERFDGPYPFFTIDQDRLDQIITRRADAVAFSSHQTLLPVPTSLDYHVLAATFLRHPILRLGSIYRFKRGAADGTVTAQLATRHDFAGWVEASFEIRNELTHVSNPQTRYLAGVYGRHAIVREEHSQLRYDLATARRNLAQVEMLGRTESFDADLRRFVGIAASHGLTLRIPEETRFNVTEEPAGSVEDRVEALLAQLPPALRSRLLKANAQDLTLYADATRLIEG
ncbi:Sulfotransferase family protein [Paracoccus isoporae]|uniref:Sulfotransferase family protein n=1 Tax=Paracoccus isoporae TaxID=591205 RepID=A0A1G7CSM9_9RHOB|nr:sulfotransferase family 2 domain-containing protein [Paracoccus isoporae]SDE42231.1 Sulfotransferase family protein [Paracoccus isoporae]